MHLWYLADPSSPRHVGHLRLVGTGVALRYAAGWLATGFPLSEDLPPLGIEHLPRSKGTAAGAVDDARPDQWGKRVIQHLDKPGRLSMPDLLLYAGDDRFGALGISDSADAYLPRRHSPLLPTLGQAHEMSEAVAKVREREPLTGIERRLVAAGAGFGGAKPKALIDIDGEPWVIKFFANEPVDVPLIEHASMTLAATAGIRVAETRIVQLLGENALAVRRFDRAGDQRIHCISAGTALRARAGAGQEPDFGYPALAQLLRAGGGDASCDGQGVLDAQELFRRMVFNILIDNTDDHEKNHALMATAMAPDRGQLRYRLSPAYDVLPSDSGQGRQEFIVGLNQRDSTLANAMSQCELFGFGRGQAAAEVARVIRVVDGWRAHFQACGVTARDVVSLAQRIDRDALLNQRRSFSPSAADG